MLKLKKQLTKQIKKPTITPLEENVYSNVSTIQLDVFDTPYYQELFSYRNFEIKDYYGLYDGIVFVDGFSQDKKEQLQSITSDVVIEPFSMYDNVDKFIIDKKHNNDYINWYMFSYNIILLVFVFISFYTLY